MIPKDSWTREEVEHLILDIVSDIAYNEKLIRHYNGDFIAAKEWINKNLI